MAYNKSERDMFKDYLQKKQGYTKAETDEVDAWMKQEYGEAWTKQEKPRKRTRWERFRTWVAWVWSGKRKEISVSEFDEYKAQQEKLSTLKSGLKDDPFTDGTTTLSIDPSFDQAPAPRRGLTSRQKKMIMLIGVVAVGALLAHVIFQQKRKRW